MSIIAIGCFIWAMFYLFGNLFMEFIDKIHEIRNKKKTAKVTSNETK